MYNTEVDFSNSALMAERKRGISDQLSNQIVLVTYTCLADVIACTRPFLMEDLVPTRKVIII
jgi:hypothetical protein